jgi:hypothetical protein
LAFVQCEKELRFREETIMAKASMGQRKTEGRIMHEFKHGELKSGRGGKGGKVKSRKQAIAIALHEAGASKYDSPAKRKQSLARSKRKEAAGETGQQEREGKSRIGARGKRESTRAMGGKNAKAPTRRAKSGGRTTTSRSGAGKRKTSRTSARKRKSS